MLLITEFMDGGDLHKAINKHQISWYKRCGALHPVPSASPRCRRL